jgi:3-oxoacyl-[acyl-carrier protein] reductase
VDRGHRVLGCSRGENDWTLHGYKHYVADVSDEKPVKGLFADIQRTYGRLDHLTNNAGIASMNHTLLTPLSTVHGVLNTNVVGTFLFCREAAKLMQTQNYGHLVNITTVAVPLKSTGEAIYVASKAAVPQLDRGFGQRICSTWQNRQRRRPSAHRDRFDSLGAKGEDRPVAGNAGNQSYWVFADVANVIDFYLKNESGFITGQSVF